MKEIDRADLAAPDKDLSRKALFPFSHVERNWDKLPDPPKETPAPEIGTKKAFVPSYMLMESGYQYAVKDAGRKRSLRVLQILRDKQRALQPVKIERRQTYT